MAGVSRNSVSAGKKHRIGERNAVEETNMDMHANVNASVKNIHEPEEYQTLETVISVPRNDLLRCTNIPCRQILMASIMAAIMAIYFVVPIVSVSITFALLNKATDGNWASWSPWSSCDITLENGTHTRTRACAAPAPSNGGLDCFGPHNDTKPCIDELHSDGGWSDWGQWSNCSVTCGYGIQTRSRTCTNPRPLFLGKYCEGDPMEVALCNKFTCSPDNQTYTSPTP